MNVEDDPYETPIFAYNKEMDQLAEANTISNEVKEDFVACPYGGMMKSNDEEENMC